MKYQPAEMKIVLTKLNVALSAGRSEVEITLKRLNRLLNCHFELSEESLNLPLQRAISKSEIFRFAQHDTDKH